MGFPALLAAGEGPNNLSIFDPASPPAAAIRDLSLLVLAITGGIFLVVELVLIYSVFRFRRRPEAGTAEPPQVYGSLPIEVAWTAAPAMIVFILILAIARTEWEVRTIPDPPQGSQALKVTVIGHQWWWEYVLDSYGSDQLGVITANELHIPSSNLQGAPDSPAERRPVVLTLQSADVCHSYWVPRLGGKTDLIPGRTNRMWFETDHEQLFLGQCAEFCGTQHAKMLLRVQVDSPEVFASWLANERRDAVMDPAVEQGRKVFNAQSCVNCHRIRYPGSPAKGTYAPDLTHLMSRKTLAAGAIDNNEENLLLWVGNPQAIKMKPGCLMPAFGLSKQQVADIVAYLVTLK
jgi:cytochrome c oxidase subunit 2